MGTFQGLFFTEQIDRDFDEAANEAKFKHTKNISQWTVSYTVLMC